jgi:hypothetical protein
MMNDEILFYCLIAVLVVLSVACILTLNIALILACLVAAFLLVAFYRLHYLVDALIFRRSNLVQLIDSCELSGERSTAVRRLGRRYCATAAALLKTGPIERVEREKVEGIIANSHCQFRFVTQVETVDIRKLLDRLNTRMSMDEIALGRLSGRNEKGNMVKINRLKRDIEHVKGEIEKISTGWAPLRVSQYIMTSAIADNRFAAQERAKSQVRELVGEFGALLGSKAEILAGNELLEVLRFDSGASV